MINLTSSGISTGEVSGIFFRVKFQMPDFRKLSFTQRENEINNSTTRPARILLSGDDSTCPMYRWVIMKSNSLYIPLTKSGSPEDSS